MLARGEQALEFEAGVVSAGSTTQLSGSTSPVPGSTSRRGGSTTPKARDVVLYVHLSEAALTSGDELAPAWIENAAGHLVTTGQVAEWCRAGSTTGTTRITVRPVLDLAETLHSTGYQPSPTLTEQIELRDRTCVFPWCQRPARGCDKDHIIPWESGGPTSSDNLAALCRRHHRMKTHGGWTYTMLTPGEYLWHSPHGHTWLRDRTGTTDLSPSTVPSPSDPPDQ
ncbi:HNH endonuclease [Nocardioides pocheonensis]|uniref:HNH endonuclease n=2 Tax=Nocardioides pocheonensis TaxID=661485 RepID=A0A3N0GVT1_9ACTN|nr:HNH endonuclease [Nocardioides pocheonensis]